MGGCREPLFFLPTLTPTLSLREREEMEGCREPLFPSPFTLTPTLSSILRTNPASEDKLREKE
jgi:hypothetical protein